MVDWHKTYYNATKDLQERTPQIRTPIDLLSTLVFANPGLSIPLSTAQAVKEVVSDPRGQWEDTKQWYGQYRDPSRQIEEHPLGVLEDIGNVAALMGTGAGFVRSMPKGTLGNMARGIGDEGGYIKIGKDTYSPGIYPGQSPKKIDVHATYRDYPKSEWDNNFLRASRDLTNDANMFKREIKRGDYDIFPEDKARMIQSENISRQTALQKLLEYEDWKLNPNKRPYYAGEYEGERRIDRRAPDEISWDEEVIGIPRLDLYNLRGGKK